MNISNVQSSLVATVLPPDSGAAAGATPLSGVVDSLTDSLTKGGQKLTDSPLGTMVAAHMDPKAVAAMSMNPHSVMAAGMGPVLGNINDEIKKGVTSLIHEKLGSDFGAAAGQGIPGGSGDGDMMSTVLKGLGKASVDGLLKEGTRGGANFDPGNKPAMNEIAKFMDAHPDKFPAPDDSKKAGTPDKPFSWQDEVKEDNYLNGPEKDSFKSAIDIVGSQMSNTGGNNPALTQQSPNAPGSGATPLDLSQVLSGQYGGLDGKSTRGSSDNNSPDLKSLLGGRPQYASQVTPGAGSPEGPGTKVADQLAKFLPELKQQDLLTSAAHTAENIINAMTKSSSSPVAA